MTEFDLVIKHLQTQRNDAFNVNVNLMLEKSKLEERVAELESQLQKTTTQMTAPKDTKGKDNGNA